MTTIFTLLVVLGFLAMLLNAFGVQHAARVGWALWFAASIIWAIQSVGLHGG